jgi:hypothetical protein
MRASSAGTSSNASRAKSICQRWMRPLTVARSGAVELSATMVAPGSSVTGVQLGQDVRPVQVVRVEDALFEAVERDVVVPRRHHDGDGGQPVQVRPGRRELLRQRALGEVARGHDGVRLQLMREALERLAHALLERRAEVQVGDVEESCQAGAGSGFGSLDTYVLAMRLAYHRVTNTASHAGTRNALHFLNGAPRRTRDSTVMRRAVKETGSPARCRSTQCWVAGA